MVNFVDIQSCIEGINCGRGGDIVPALSSLCICVEENEVLSKAEGNPMRMPITFCVYHHKYFKSSSCMMWVYLCFQLLN